MDLQKRCLECVHLLRIGDNAQGIKLTLEVFQELQQFMKNILIACERDNESNVKVSQNEILEQLKNLVMYIEKNDGVGLADTLEYQIVDTISKYCGKTSSK